MSTAKFIGRMMGRIRQIIFRVTLLSKQIGVTDNQLIDFGIQQHINPLRKVRLLNYKLRFFFSFLTKPRRFFSVVATRIRFKIFPD